MALWLGERPLVLASKSAVRHALLRAAGIAVEVEPADLDERALEQRMPTSDRGGTVLLEHREAARLTMRAFSDDFLESYLDAAGAAVTASVGGYQLEKAGIQLFERIEGDHFVILGLPLLALLHYFRQQRWLAA